MAGDSPDPAQTARLPSVVQRPDALVTRARVSLQLRVLDLADRMKGRRDRLTPPRRMSQYVGHGDFAAVGDEFLALMRTHAGLTAGDRVLDVGCGIGRMARVLTAVLRPPGSYDGFDVTRSGIEWCRKRYHGLPVPFRFRHVDLANDTYNPHARATAASFRFPYADQAFDLVIGTSVFTHLLPEETSNYLHEISRVLAPGGRLFSTWFVLDDDQPPPAPFQGRHDHGTALIADPDTPSAAVGYPLDHLTREFRRCALEIDPIRRGSWRTDDGPSLQDIIVARRPR